MLSRIKWSSHIALQMLWQPRIPFLPDATIKHIQTKRVRKIVAHAYRWVPYYRETMDSLGLKPADFRTADDLAKLPVIEPHQLQVNPEYFVSRHAEQSSYSKLLTGGSTGDPRKVYHSKNSILQNAGHGERERPLIASILGRKLGYRETVLISRNSTCEKLQALSRSSSIIPPQLAITRQYLSLMDTPEFNLPLINEFKPDIIDTYGSYLAILFSYLAETGADFHRPKLVRYSSDGLPENARRLISERFGIPVFSAYQANEALKMGFECECHTGYHLNIDLYPLRIADADGRTLPDGQSGDVIVSNTVNTATVLLNYRLGDLAAMIPERCSCGRMLPMLTFPPGRCDDLLKLSSGRMLHPQAVRTVFTTEEEVWQYQVIQNSPGRLTAKVVVAGSADHVGLRTRILERLKVCFGPEIAVDLSFVDTIDRTKAGKFRPIISMQTAARVPALNKDARNNVDQQSD